MQWENQNEKHPVKRGCEPMLVPGIYPPARLTVNLLGKTRRREFGIMTRILGAIFFVFWMGLAMSQNIAGTWDVFDIAAIIFGFGALTVLIWDADF